MRGNATAIRALNPLGCQQVGVNSQRAGFVVNRRRHDRGAQQPLPQRRPAGHQDRSASAAARRIKGYVDFYNLFDIENLYFGSNGRLGLSTATAGGTFMQASSLYGPGFGPPVGRPLTVVFGGRFEF